MFRLTYLLTMSLTQADQTHGMQSKIQPNPSHGWTQPMSISASLYLSRDSVQLRGRKKHLLSSKLQSNDDVIRQLCNH